MSFNDVAIVTNGRNNYRIQLWFMTKSEAVNTIKNADLNEKHGQSCYYDYKKNIYYNNGK